MIYLRNAGVLVALSAVATCSVFAACSSRDPSHIAAQGPSGPGEFDTEGTDAASGTCTAAAKLVYVLSGEGDLYSFAPSDKAFTMIGPVSCVTGGHFISMAVDRKAVARVNIRHQDGDGKYVRDLFDVDTKTGACTPSAIDDQPMGGMGFSTDGDNTAADTLFIQLGKGLARLDATGRSLDYIADLKTNNLELTGTGDGRLYGFINGDPLQLVQIDKTSGAFSNVVDLTGVKKPLGQFYAFSFWGGDFYIYTADSNTAANTTTVARYSPSTGDLEKAYMDQIGFHIVGAGVSTCAPVSLR